MSFRCEYGRARKTGSAWAWLDAYGAILALPSLRLLSIIPKGKDDVFIYYRLYKNGTANLAYSLCLA